MANLKLNYNETVRRRLDEFLVKQEGIHSRSFASKLIKNGNVKINGSIEVRPSYKLSAGDLVEAIIEDLMPEIKVLPEEVPFKVLYEDDYILILDKPAGVVVHPGAGNWNGTLVSGLVNHWGKIPEGLDKNRPGIVHRLDKDTSGLMLIAKNARAVAYYSDLFKQHKIQKKYIALVYGKVPERIGDISSNIARHPVDRKKMTVVDPQEGRYAETHYKVIGYYVNPKDPKNTYTLVEVLLKTGRTHQIRVHFKHLGYPLVGDRVYSGRRLRGLYPEASRQLLHAYSLKFEDIKGDHLHFKALPPSDFNNYLKSLVKIDD